MIDHRELLRWRRIVDALRAEAERLGDPRARARKQVEIGDTLFDRLGDAHGAAEAWLAAVEADPHDAGDALRRLERLARESKDGRLYQRWVGGLRRAGRWAEVIDLMGRRAASTRDPHKRCKLRLEAARLCAERMGDAAGARRFLVAAAEDAGADVLDRVQRPLRAHLREAPDDEEAATALARLLARCDRADAAVDVLVDAAAHLRDLDRKAALLYEAAFLAERAGHLARAPKLLGDALVYAPRREPEVVARLDALERARPDDDALLDALLETWDRLDRPARSQSLLAARVARSAGRRAEALRLRQARHAEEVLGDRDRAFSLFQAVAATAPEPAEAIAGLRRTALGRPGAFDIIADLCTRRQRWAELAELCTDEAALRADDGERAALLHRAGAVYEERLGDLDRAMARYVDAFRLRPREEVYLSAGERLYRRQGDWAMVDRLLGLRLRVLDDDADRRAVLVEQATLRWQRLGDAPGAYDALRDALRRLGDATVEDGAFEMLEGLVADPVAFEAIAGALRTRAETADDAVAGARLLVELAGLHLDLRADREAGLSLLHDAVDRAPADARLFADVAARIGQHAGREAEAAFWRGAADRPLPAEARVAALRRAATLWAADPARALDGWRALLTVDPTDDGALSGAIAAAEALGTTAAAQAVVDLLGPAIDGVRGPDPTPTRVAGWLRALARAHARRAAPEAEAAAWAALLDRAPDDAEALAALEPALREAGDLRGLAARLAAAIRAIEAGGALAADQRASLGALYAGPLADPGAAARWLLPLAQRPAHAAAMRPRVFALLDAAGDRPAAIDFARRVLRDAPDDGARLDAAERLVRLAEAEGDETALTIGLLALSDAAPDDARPALRLAELARRTGDDDALLTALERLAAQTPGPRGLPLRRELARLLGERRSDPPAAIAAWDAVLAHAPDDTEALAALQRLHARAGDDETVHRLLWRRQAATEDAEDRVALLREAAVVAEFRLGAPDRAMAAWRAVCAVEPDHPEALDELIRLAEDEGDHAAMLENARRRVAQLAGADRAELARRMAEVCADALADPEAAVDWWRLVAEVEPDDPEALDALAEDAERRGADAVALLLWGRLAAGDRSPRLRRKALRRRAEALSAGDDPEAAMAAWRAVAEAAPDDPSPWAELGRIAEAIGDAAVAAEALGGQIARTRGAERAALERALARLLDAEAAETGDVAAAIAAWERVLASAPQDTEALDALERRYAEQGRTLEMLRVLDTLARTVPLDAARARLADAARRVEARGDAATAFECWRRHHDLADDVAREALDELARLARAARRWSACAEALAVSAGRSADPAEQRGLMLEAADIWHREVGDVPRAFGQVQAACALDPALPEPLERLAALAAGIDDDRTWAALAEALIQAAEADPRRRAAHLLRTAEITEARRGRLDVAFALLARAFEGEGCEGEVGAQVEAALVRLAGRAGRWDEVVELFDARARLLGDASAQAALLARLGAVLERDARRPEAAFEQYLLAFQLRPNAPAIRDATHRLAGALDMWEVVERVLRIALENADGPRARVEVLRALADLQAGPLGDPDASLRTLERAFALDPGDADCRAALEAMATARGAREALAAFYEDEAGWAESRGHRIALYRAAIDAYKSLGRQVEAAAVLRKLDRLAPGDSELIDERLDLLRAADDPAPLAAALENQIGRAEGPRRLELLREVAAVYADRLDRPEDAEGAWRRVLEARPHDAEAFEALTASLAARGAWRALDEALARRIERTTAATRRALLRRRAELLHRRLGRPVDGFALLAEVARAEPGDLELLSTLAERAPIAGAWAELVACAERAVAVVPRARLAEVLLLIGRTARDRLSDPRKALSALGRALEQQPDDLALAREVAALMRTRRQFGPLVELHRRLGPALLADPGAPADAPEADARWALALAELLAERLYRTEEAIEVLRGLVARQPLHVDAARRLRAVCGRAQDGPGLLDAIERLAGLTQGVERLTTLVEGARALAGIGETERAVRVWRTVLAEAPGHPEAQRAVARQAARQEDWALMVEQLEARVRAARGPEARADLLCELGVLHQHRREDPEAAAAAYARALSAAPRHVDALVGHVELARRGADPKALAGLAERLIARLEGDAAAAEVLLPLLAEIQLDRASAATAAGDEDAALAILAGLHGRLPDDPRIGQAHADALYAVGDLARAAALYRALPMPPAEDDAEAEQRAREHVRRARALRAVGDDDAAMRHFEAAAGHPATRACALEQLANLHERAAHWEAAARLREKLAEAVDDPQAQRAAWVAAGLIHEHRLGRAVRAMQAYDRAVDGGLGEPVLLGGILRLYREQQRPERVLQVTERLLAGDPAARRRAELWCDRGWAHAARGDLAGARDARRVALSHDPASPEAAGGLLEGLDAAGSVEQAETLDAAERALARLEGAARGPLLGTLSGWWLAHGAPDRAEPLVAELVALRPAEHGLRVTLAELLAARADRVEAARRGAEAAEVIGDGSADAICGVIGGTIGDDSTGAAADAIDDDSMDGARDAIADNSADAIGDPSAPLDAEPDTSEDRPPAEAPADDAQAAIAHDSAPSVADAPAAAEDASVDDSAADIPDADDAVTDASAADASAADASAVDASAVDASAADASAVDASAVDVSGADVAVADDAIADAATPRAADDGPSPAALRRAALVHRRAAVRLRPADTGDLRALAALCAAAERPRWSALPRGLLALVGAGDPPPPLRDGLPPPLGAAARKAHLATDAWRSPTGLLLNALHTWIARPLDGLLRDARGEVGRPVAELDPALAAEAEAVARALGLAFAEIRVDPEADAPMDLAGLAPPVPVIGRPILEIDDLALRRFALARGFELTRGCAAHAAYVPPTEARALFAGAVALARPEDGADFALAIDAPPDRVAWWAELLLELLDPRRLDALAKFAAPVAAGPKDAFARWAEAVHRTADRVALWISGDLAAGVAWLWQLDPALAEHRPASPRALRTLLDAAPDIAALHAAAFDDGFWDLLEATEAAAAIGETAGDDAVDVFADGFSDDFDVPADGFDDAADDAPPAEAAPLAEALREGPEPAPDLAAAADAGLSGAAVERPTDIDLPMPRIVGAAPPGPAVPMAALSHLFDDLDALVADAEDGPTDAVERAALALPAEAPAPAEAMPSAEPPGEPQSSAPQSSAPQSSAPQSSAPQSSAPQPATPQPPEPEPSEAARSVRAPRPIPSALLLPDAEAAADEEAITAVTRVDAAPEVDRPPGEVVPADPDTDLPLAHAPEPADEPADEPDTDPPIAHAPEPADEPDDPDTDPPIAHAPEPADEPDDPDTDPPLARAPEPAGDPDTDPPLAHAPEPADDPDTDPPIALDPVLDLAPEGPGVDAVGEATMDESLVDLEPLDESAEPGDGP